MSGTAFRAKQAAARLRISFSCSSRLFARFSRASSAASAFCRARASAKPAARRSLRHILSWLAWTPSSAATCCRALPLSSSRLTASALYSAVNRRRLRSCAILRSRCWWNLPYEGVHPARAGSLGHLAPKVAAGGLTLGGLVATLSTVTGFVASRPVLKEVALRVGVVLLAVGLLAVAVALPEWLAGWLDEAGLGVGRGWARGVVVLGSAVAAAASLLASLRARLDQLRLHPLYPDRLME